MIFILQSLTDREIKLIHIGKCQCEKISFLDASLAPSFVRSFLRRALPFVTTRLGHILIERLSISLRAFSSQLKNYSTLKFALPARAFTLIISI